MVDHWVCLEFFQKIQWYVPAYHNHRNLFYFDCQRAKLSIFWPILTHCFFYSYRCLFRFTSYIGYRGWLFAFQQLIHLVYSYRVQFHFHYWATPINNFHQLLLGLRFPLGNKIISCFQQWQSIKLAIYIMNCRK